MPQLDTIHTFLVFNWTWLLLLLISQKIKTFRITKGPVTLQHKTHKTHTQMLPWT